jgi:hypothetical protein
MSKGPLNEEEDFGYVSPADFDEPGDTQDDIKVKDEVDLPILEEVVIYLQHQIDKCSSIHVLEVKPESGLSIEQQLVMYQQLAIKLGTAKKSIEAIIEGIDDKYDDTNR